MENAIAAEEREGPDSEKDLVDSYLASSIAKGKGLVCVLCKMQIPTEHIMVHTSSTLRRIMRMVLKLRNRPFSLLELQDRLKEV